jgi:hypothetical protein
VNLSEMHTILLLIFTYTGDTLVCMSAYHIQIVVYITVVMRS